VRPPSLSNPSERPASPPDTAPAAVRQARGTGPQRRHGGTAPVRDLHLGDLAATADGHRDRLAGPPGSTVPDALGHQLADQEHRRLNRRVLAPEYGRRERTATATRSGRPGDGHALTSPPLWPWPHCPFRSRPPLPPLPSAPRKGCELTAGRGNPAPIHASLAGPRQGNARPAACRGDPRVSTDPLDIGLAPVPDPVSAAPGG
jgi:hypothetical protein